MPNSMLPGHACYFAKDFVDDPFVKNGVELYNRVSEEKDRFTMEGHYAKAWDSVLQLRAIHAELFAHCEKLKRDRKKSN